VTAIKRILVDGASEVWTRCFFWRGSSRWGDEEPKPVPGEEDRAVVMAKRRVRQPILFCIAEFGGVYR